MSAGSRCAPGHAETCWRGVRHRQGQGMQSVGILNSLQVNSTHSQWMKTLGTQPEQMADIEPKLRQASLPAKLARRGEWWGTET